MPRSPSSRRSVPSGLAAFAKRQDGATAVEFGLIALPFLGLLFAIIETALTFWSTQVLETAVSNASRQIYTGQFQNNAANRNLTAAELRDKFKVLVCSNVTAVFDCTGRVAIDVRSVTSYADASVSRPISNGRFDTTSYGYSAPAADQITVVRAAMEYPVYLNIMFPSTGLTNGNRLIMAAAVFRTEPF